MRVSTEEFIPARDASRRLGQLVDRLESGELDKAIIVYRNSPRAVMFAFEGAWGEHLDLEVAARALYAKLAQTHPGDMAEREGWLDEWNALSRALAMLERNRGTQA